MIEAAERILESYAAGRMSRREAALLVAGLALASLGIRGGPAAASTPSTSPTFRATALNHLGLRVSDVGRSRDFYQQHLGLSVIRDNSPGNCFLQVGENYLGLFRSSAPAVDHFCFTVETYDADAAMTRSAKAGLEPRREEDRVYFDDPDGLEIQLDSRFGSWPGPPPVDDEQPGSGSR